MSWCGLKVWHPNWMWYAMVWNEWCWGYCFFHRWRKKEEKIVNAQVKTHNFHLYWSMKICFYFFSCLILSDMVLRYCPLCSCSQFSHKMAVWVHAERLLMAPRALQTHHPDPSQQLHRSCAGTSSALDRVLSAPWGESLMSLFIHSGKAA